MICGMTQADQRAQQTRHTQTPVDIEPPGAGGVALFATGSQAASLRAAYRRGHLHYKPGSVPPTCFAAIKNPKIKSAHSAIRKSVHSTV
jgi:hypothetical protein